MSEPVVQGVSHTDSLRADINQGDIHFYKPMKKALRNKAESLNHVILTSMLTVANLEKR